MAKSSTLSFNDAVARLDSDSLKISLSVQRTKPCSAPQWDPHSTYRVALVGDHPMIQKLVGQNEWVEASLVSPRSAPGDAHDAQSNGIRIFISHSAKDSGLAKKLIAVLEAAVAIPHEPLAIRCTSVYGYRLAPGDVSSEVLRLNLKECAVVIGLLTDASVESRYVLLELGAAWGFARTVCMLLAPSLGFDALPGPLANVHAVRMADDRELMELVDTVAERTGFPRTGNSAKTADAVQEFIGAVRALATVAPSQTGSTFASTTDDELATGDDAELLLHGWLTNLDEARDGQPIQFTVIDKETAIAAGMAKLHLPAVIAQSKKWEIARSTEKLVILQMKPLRIGQVHRAKSMFDGSDF